MTTNSSEKSAAWIAFPASVALRRARDSSTNARRVKKSDAVCHAGFLAIAFPPVLPLRMLAHGREHLFLAVHRYIGLTTTEGWVRKRCIPGIGSGTGRGVWHGLGGRGKGRAGVKICMYSGLTGRRRPCTAFYSSPFYCNVPCDRGISLSSKLRFVTQGGHASSDAAFGTGHCGFVFDIGALASGGDPVT